MAECTLIKVTKAYFDANGFRYREDEDRENVLIVSFSMDNRDSLKMLVFFEEDRGAIVKIRSFDITKFPADRKPAMYAACNKLNQDYRFVKFFVDESDNTITADCDLETSVDMVGEEVRHCCGRMASIVDDAYPELQKAIWA